MTLKEEFLKISTKEELLERQEEFDDLEQDRDVLEHMSKLIGPLYPQEYIDKKIIVELPMREQ